MLALAGVGWECIATDVLFEEDTMQRSIKTSGTVYVDQGKEDRGKYGELFSIEDLEVHG